LHELVDVKKKYAKDKEEISKQKFEHLRKDSVYLIDSLVEYGQRRDLGLLEKTKIVLTHDGKHSELFLTKPAFLVDGKKIKKIVNGKLVDSDVNALNVVLSKFKGGAVGLDSEMIKILEKELGKIEVCF